MIEIKFSTKFQFTSNPNSQEFKYEALEQLINAVSIFFQKPVYEKKDINRKVCLPCVAWSERVMVRDVSRLYKCFYKC